MLIFHSIKEFFNSLKTIDKLSPEAKYIIQSSLRKCKSCNTMKRINYKVDIVTVQLLPLSLTCEELNLIKSHFSTDKIQVKINNKILVEF